ncbi:MAG: WD40/YVTN/BNR-like repeat-containing protein, partial [Pyrinomonadaceae bacterium]
MFFALFSGSLFGQRSADGWQWQNPLPQGNPLYSIQFAPDKVTGYAVGSDGTILRTENGGFDWMRQDARTTVSLSGVFVRDEDTAFAVGSRGTLVTTLNGKDWRPVPIDTKDHLAAIVFAGKDRNVGWIVGTYGRILKTIDAGLTWKQQTSGTREQLLRIDAFDETHAAAVGLNGIVLTTTDGGDTWRSSDPCKGAVVSSVAYLSTTAITVAGYNGCVARSDDAGEHWSRADLYSRSDFLSIGFASDKTGS